MYFEKISFLLKNSTTVKLLRAENAPLIISFFHEVFKGNNKRDTITEKEIIILLTDYLYQINQDKILFPQTAKEYLTAWSADGAGYLRRYPENDELVYELTPSAENALKWIDELEKPAFVGTDSRLINPLGMTNTRYVVPANDRQKLAGMYRRSTDGQLTRVPDDENTYNIKNWPLKTGGFGLTSTLDDYMKFARMLVNKGKLGKVTILKPETVKLMATNQLAESITERMWLPSKGQVGFGIDFAVRLRPPFAKEENNGVVGEFFWDGAASTLFWVDPVNQITAVLFVQVMPFYGQLHKRFRDAVYGEYSPK